MGCTGPKSVISVRNDLTFLDMTVRQIEVSSLSFIVNLTLSVLKVFRHLCCDYRFVFDLIIPGKPRKATSDNHCPSFFVESRQ